MSRRRKKRVARGAEFIAERPQQKKSDQAKNRLSLILDEISKDLTERRQD